MAINCPWCGALAPFDLRTAWDAPSFPASPFQPVRIAPSGGQVRIGAWACSNCGHPVSGFVGQGTRAEPAMWWPPTMLEPPALEHVPESVEANRSEAYHCQSVRAYRGAVSMVRRAIQASAFDLGVPDDRAHQKLHQQIDWLAETGAITPQLKELAHELRFFGNDGAHPDRDGLENVSKEDAAVALGSSRTSSDTPMSCLDESRQSPRRGSRRRRRRTEGLSEIAARRTGRRNAALLAGRPLLRIARRTEQQSREPKKAVSRAALPSRSSSPPSRASSPPARRSFARARRLSDRTPPRGPH